MTHDELNNLAVRAREGDGQAVNALLVELDGLVRHLASGFCVAGAATDDLVQEARIALNDAAAAYDDSKGNFYTFCRRCVQNRLVSSARASKRAKNSFLSNYAPIDEAAAVQSSQPLPEDELIRREDVAEFNRRIELVLSDFEKSVLVEFLSGKDYRGIAEALSTTVKAVDNALTRIRNKLRT